MNEEIMDIAALLILLFFLFWLNIHVIKGTFVRIDKILPS